MTKLTAWLTGIVLLVALATAAGAQPQSTWDQMKETGKLKFAMFSYAPYFVKDPASGEWGGAPVEMARDVANELKVELELVEVGGWSELVLAISTGKVDCAAGMQAIPIRATAIDFAGPIYWIEWVTVNNPDFDGKNWEDYNNPDVKVAVMTGSSDQLLLEKWAPKATQIQFKELSQIILAVSSGRGRLHDHRALEHDRQGEEPGARQPQYAQAARGASRLLRHPPGDGSRHRDREIGCQTTTA